MHAKGGNDFSVLVQGWLRNLAMHDIPGVHAEVAAAPDSWVRL